MPRAWAVLWFGLGWGVTAHVVAGGFEAKKLAAIDKAVEAVGMKRKTAEHTWLIRGWMRDGQKLAAVKPGAPLEVRFGPIAMP